MGYILLLTTDRMSRQTNCKDIKASTKSLIKASPNIYWTLYPRTPNYTSFWNEHETVKFSYMLGYKANFNNF